MKTPDRNQIEQTTNQGFDAPLAARLPFSKKMIHLGKTALGYTSERLHTTAAFRAKAAQKAFAPIAAPHPTSYFVKEIQRLRPEQAVVHADEFTVFQARSWQIPYLMDEIARLRETAFRAEGLGTGKALDLDKYDSYYDHIFIWHKASCELVGAYRVGRVDEILDVFGKKGLYTHTLFKLKKPFFKATGSMLELGRSFVRPEYQRTPSALFLLWKGIGQYIIRRPQYKTLFGPVSISNAYSELSRQLLVDFLTEQTFHPELAKLVKPRNPFQQKVTKSWDAKIATRMFDNLDDLAAFISGIEPDKKSIPTLLKHYLKLGGRLLGFNIDAAFCRSLDGLMVVDLMEANQRMLERFMGEGWTTLFVGLHRWQENRSEKS